MTMTMIDQRLPTYSHRAATPEEIAEHSAYALKYGERVMFSHYPRERYSRDGSRVVSRYQYSRSKVVLIDGVVHVTYQGRKEPVKLTAYINNETGRTFFGAYSVK
jgi:calcineurin-like phosphoesterase family protein